MNTKDLFLALGEVSQEKLILSEQRERGKRPKLRRFVAAAAAISVLLAMTLAVNASTDGALLGRLRLWLNGNPVSSDLRVHPAQNGTGEETYEIQLDSGLEVNEVIAARTDETAEHLQIYVDRQTETYTGIGFGMQINTVEETDGKIILHYGQEDIDLTAPLSLGNQCDIDYTVAWLNDYETHLTITVQRTGEGQYSVFTSPAK